MHQPKPLEFVDFQSTQNEILRKLQNSNQGKYLYHYLTDLGTQKILIEHNYFDRDYLSEFSAFYSASASGYMNICTRLHFFSHNDITREFFEQAVGENTDSERVKKLNKYYLGFCVIRPIKACLGKTVLKWYPNKEQVKQQRITIKRNYKCHIAGIELSIQGLAWQQQDRGIGACATIALWSALQSSAFDDFHAIPTTTEITKLAHKTAAMGSKTFPSTGLTEPQLYESIKELGLSPMVQDGDYRLKDKTYFTNDMLMSSVASYIRSGYPVIILGNLITNANDNSILHHAVCVVGFKDIFSIRKPVHKIILSDSSNNILYVHDDNIGPNARFKLTTNNMHAVLQLEPPQDSLCKDTTNYKIVPVKLVIATHSELRASPTQLHYIGVQQAKKWYNILSLLFKRADNDVNLSLSTRFIKLTDYIQIELYRILSADSEKLSRTRLRLCEKVRPMSLHIGLVRIGLANSSTPFIDLLYDTTDSDLKYLTYVPYNPAIEKIEGSLVGKTYFTPPH